MNNDTNTNSIINDINDIDDIDDIDDSYDADDLEGLNEWNKDYNDNSDDDDVYDNNSDNDDNDNDDNVVIYNTIDITSSSYVDDSLNNNNDDDDTIQFSSTADGYVTYTNTNTNNKITQATLIYGSSITTMQASNSSSNGNADNITSSPFTTGILCNEIDIVNLILEMLLGNSNELFSLLPVSTDSNRLAFSLTYTAKNIRTSRLSSLSLMNMLQWFACLGSYIRICREFAFGNYPNNDAGHDYGHNDVGHNDVGHNSKKHRNELESVRAATIELLDIIEKELSLLNTDVTTNRDRSSDDDDNDDDNNDDTNKLKPIKYDRTIIALYCLFRQWSSFFESINAIIETLIAPNNSKSNDNDYNANAHITSLIDEIQNCLRYLSLSSFPYMHTNDYSPYQRKKMVSNSIKQDYDLCIDFDHPKAQYNLYHGFNQLCYQFSIQEYLLKYTKDLYKGKGLNDDDLCSNAKGLDSNKKNIPMIANIIDDCLTSCHLEAQIISSDNKKLQSFGSLQKGIIECIKGYKLQYPSRAYYSFNSDNNDLSFDTIEVLEKGTQFKRRGLANPVVKKPESKKLNIDKYLSNRSKESLRQYQIYDHSYPEVCAFFSNIPMFKTYLNKKKSELGKEEADQAQKKLEWIDKQKKLKDKCYPEMLKLQAYGCITPAYLQLFLTISQPISVSLRQAYSAAAKYTRYDYKLSQNILFLQQVFLLGQLDIFDPIRLAIESSFSHLNEPKHVGHDIDLLSESLYHYVQQYIPSSDIETVKHLSITLYDYNSDDRSSLSSSNKRITQQNDIIFGPSIFKNLTIELHHTWPLSGNTTTTSTFIVITTTTTAATITITTTTNF